MVGTWGDLYYNNDQSLTAITRRAALAHHALDELQEEKEILIHRGQLAAALLQRLDDAQHGRGVLAGVDGRWKAHSSDGSRSNITILVGDTSHRQVGR